MISKQSNENTFAAMCWKSSLLARFNLFRLSDSLAQDARELQQERAASNKLKGEHPLIELMRTRKSTLRPELMGVHPTRLRYGQRDC